MWKILLILTTILIQFDCFTGFISNKKVSSQKSTKFLNKSGLTKVNVTEDEVQVFFKVFSSLLSDLKEEQSSLAGNTIKKKSCLTSQFLKSLDDDSQIVLLETPEEITLTSLLYKKPQSWSPCRRSCKTSRIRECRQPHLCSEDIRVEEALCYIPGSKCERIVKEIVDKRENISAENTELVGNVSESTTENSQHVEHGMNENPEHDYDVNIEEDQFDSYVDNHHYDTEDEDFYLNQNVHYDDEEELVDDELVKILLDLLNIDSEKDEHQFYSPNNGTSDDEQTEEPHFDYDIYGSQYDDEDLGVDSDDVGGATEYVGGDMEDVGWAKFQKDKNCGKVSVSVPNKMFRIIGGKEAVMGSWPWQVAILNRFKELYCGGTLIAPRWVITAAHCVRKKMFVRMGEHDIRTYDGEREIRVLKSIIHPSYNPETIDSDIALLRLPKKAMKKVRRLKKVKTACLPQPKSSLPLKSQRQCVVLGWGKERESHIFGSDVLRYAKVPIVNRDVCLKAYDDYIISRNMFCAGYLKGGIDACEGDSGGPLLCQDSKGRWTVEGITSFGVGCGEKGRFGVYIRVANYLPWIVNNIK